MRKLSLVLLMMLVVFPFNGYAKSNKITRQDFIGDWICQTNVEIDGDLMITKTLDNIRADGTMSQVWEQTNFILPNKIVDIEFIVVKNRWDYNNGFFKNYDYQIQDYKIYDSNKIALNEEIRSARQAQWQEIYDDVYSVKVNFVNKDNFRFVYEAEELEGYDKGTTECKRITKI